MNDDNINQIDSENLRKECQEFYSKLMGFLKSDDIYNKYSLAANLIVFKNHLDFINLTVDKVAAEIEEELDEH